MPPWATIDSAISARMSSQMPMDLGAAKACSCTAESARTAVAPDDLSGGLLDLEAQLHARDPADPQGTEIEPASLELSTSLAS